MAIRSGGPSLDVAERAQAGLDRRLVRSGAPPLVLDRVRLAVGNVADGRGGARLGRQEVEQRRHVHAVRDGYAEEAEDGRRERLDRKSTRLNSSHGSISY